ncbi:MAG: DUF2182 domain-containing protein [Gemmatimonadota bacterium]|nr:DUF2182 domain-containing protein [Gemmatimonadota bacterium]
MAESGFWFVLAMWAGMTAVMMTPVVWPWLRALSRIQPERAGVGTVPAFATGYAVAWGVFSTVMAALQQSLLDVGWAAPLRVSAPTLAGMALLAAGGFQFTRLKEACLSHCRSPFGYFAANWRPGVSGALAMGLRHGLFCLGCCWAIMALALVLGMMDLRMMALLMAVMLLETLGPWGTRLSRPLGVGLVLWGAALVLS